MRVTGRRMLNAALLTIAVTATTAGCGVSGITTLADTVRAGTGTLAIPLPLDGKSASQIATMSLQDLKNASSVRYTGTHDDSGHLATITVTDVKGVGCAGSLNEQGQKVQLVINGKTAWMKGDDAFWTANGATGAAMNLLADNYIKVTKSSFVSQFAGLCEAATVAANVITSKPTGLADTKIIVNNQAAVEVKKTGTSSTMVVTDTTTPEILRMNTTGTNGGTFTFSDFNQKATIAPPPTDQTLDGAQFGL